ncbi:uncharacterized protein CTRU02_202413 [Colletotrichum truncatum]|uniref:Uncharacterized protein n=1 Tax=Colletotrichum truncatum TaxID=5467 RepID=A0ACC3ZK62_COLTU|nr:uncharacterized protein CTRU02_01575 [Colletotrichum truncatum]KAF6799896.1 hypothetical protein CTRU02_01575 [Colletotrichum truncatum]
MAGSLATRKRAPPPPNLDLDTVRRTLQSDGPKTPPGPLTPHRPLIVSNLPEPIHPTSTITSQRPLTPQPTRPSTFTSGFAGPSDTSSSSSTSKPQQTTLIISTTATSFGVVSSPTNTIFVTAAPQTVTVTAAPVPSTAPGPGGIDDTKPQPSTVAPTPGVSFTTGAGVVVIGVLGGIGIKRLFQRH